MHVEFDTAKNERNIRERGISFTQASRFEFDTSIRAQDLRRDYGEVRMRALGFIDGRLHMLCFKPIGKNHIRVISLRKANVKERKTYEKEKAKEARLRRH